MDTRPMQGESAPEGFPESLAELIARQEPLIAPLASRCENLGRFIAIRHPLLYVVPFVLGMEALANAQFRAKVQRARELLDEGQLEQYVWLHERPTWARAPDAR